MTITVQSQRHLHYHWKKSNTTNNSEVQCFFSKQKCRSNSITALSQSWFLQQFMQVMPSYSEDSIMQYWFSVFQCRNPIKHAIYIVSVTILLISISYHTHACMHACMHTTVFGPLGFCPGLPGWASTRKLKPIWIYWSKR